MKKPFAQFSLLLTLFFGTWFLLGQMDFVGDFHIRQISEENEHRIGDFILTAMRQGNRELESDSVRTCIESILHTLCTANDIADSSLKLHLIVKDDVNAFALPDRHLVVYSGLVAYCKRPEELAGVLAHEIAHIEHHHVMKKLITDVGLSMLTTMAGGGSGGEIGRETVRLLSSTAFDRDQESEADKAAVHYMAKAGIDPEYLANFLFRLSQEKGNIPRHFEWISTHPNSQDRSAEILNLRKLETFHAKALVDSGMWEHVRRLAGTANH